MNRRTFLTSIAAVPLAPLAVWQQAWNSAEASKYIAYIRVDDHRWTAWSIGKDGLIVNHGPGWTKQ